MRERIAVKAFGIAVAKLERAAIIGADLKRKFIAVIPRPNLDGQPNYFQVILASDVLSFTLILFVAFTS